MQVLTASGNLSSHGLKLGLLVCVPCVVQYQKVAPDEMVFRSLIDACGRLGNVDLAMKVCRHIQTQR